MSLYIRPASPDDTEALLGLARSVLDDGDPAPVHSAWTARLLAGEGPPLAHGDVMVAHDGPEPVGMVWLLPQPLQVRGVEVSAGQVEQLAVVPAHRGRGVARMLLSALATRARERGLLFTFVRGETALYERLGHSAALPRTRPVLLPSSDVERSGGISAVPAVPDDAALLAAWDSEQPTTLVRRPRDESAWRTEVVRASSHPWRTSVWLAVDRGGTPHGAAGVLHMPAGPPVLHHLHVAPGSDAAAVGCAGLAALRRCAGDGPAGLLLPPGHPVRDVLEDLPGPVAAAPWGVAVPDVVALFSRVVGGRSPTIRTAGSPADVVIAIAGATVRWDVRSAMVGPAPDREAHARFTPAGLAALVLGACSVEALLAVGAASVSDPRVAGVLAEALPPGTCDLWPLA